MRTKMQAIDMVEKMLQETPMTPELHKEIGEKGRENMRQERNARRRELYAQKKAAKGKTA